MKYLDKLGLDLTEPAGFLVSGSDTYIHMVMARAILASVRQRSKTLYVVNNTQNDLSTTDFDGYRLVNLLTEEVCLCADLLAVDTLQKVVLLKSLLEELGLDSVTAMQVVSYLEFVRESENRLGNRKPLTVDTLEAYSTTQLVRWKMDRLLSQGGITRDTHDYLLDKFLEISHAAADFEQVLRILGPFMDGITPTCNMAVHLPVGELSDEAVQGVLCKLLAAHIKQEQNCAVLVLDDGKSKRRVVTDFLRRLPGGLEVHMLSADAFTGEDSNVLINTFPVRVYTRHDNMNSCEEIQNLLGQLEIERHTYSETTDLRLRSNTGWDLLLGTNKTRTVNRVLSKEYLFPKEMIHTLSSRTAIIDCQGNKTPCSF